MEKKAVLFDLDGTLWDATGRITESWNRAIARSGSPELAVDREKIKRVQGMTLEAIGKKLFPGLPADVREKLVYDCESDTIKSLKLYGGSLFDGLIPTLSELHRKYFLAVVSNCSDGYIDSFLLPHRLCEYFDDNECAGRTGLSKSENIRLVMARNRISFAVYVGDTVLDYEAAKEAGVPFIHASYGFGIVEDAEYSVSDIRELPELVDRIFKSLPH